MNASAVVGLVGLVLCVGALASTVFWVWSLVDATKRPDGQWDAAEQNKTVWIVVIVVVGCVGSLLYVLVPRPALRRIEAASGMQFDPTAFGVPHGGLQYGKDGFEHPSPSHQ